MKGLATIILSTFLVMAFFAPDSVPIVLVEKNSPPSLEHLIGTDELGRDLLLRLCMGAKSTLLIGMVVGLSDLCIGVSYGFFAGFYGRRTEFWMMRALDAFDGLPHLLIALFLVVLFGPGLTTLIIALSLTGWVRSARVLRLHTAQLMRQGFVQASLAMGGSKIHILSQHIYPHSRDVILLMFVYAIRYAIVGESLLSFVGLGISPPNTSWGMMLAEGVASFPDYFWRLLAPATAISLLVLSLNLLVEGQNEHV